MPPDVGGSRKKNRLTIFLLSVVNTTFVHSAAFSAMSQAAHKGHGNAAQDGLRAQTGEKMRADMFKAVQQEKERLQEETAAYRLQGESRAPPRSNLPIPTSDPDFRSHLPIRISGRSVSGPKYPSLLPVPAPDPALPIPNCRRGCRITAFRRQL
jgi:hypothetical protein